MKKIILTILMAVILTNLSPIEYLKLKTDLTTKISKNQAITMDEGQNWVGMVNNLAKECKVLRLKNINFKDIISRLNNLLANNKCSE